MKKIFTCISLAAATFMATTPVMAQQQKQLTDKEKAAVVKVIVPAVFDQVKQISGVDFMSLANPNIENVINFPVIFATSIKFTCRSTKHNLGYSG